jgi:phage terminase small subunit
MAKGQHLTPKEARFFRLYINGMTATDAYLKLCPHVQRDSADEMGCRMLKRIKRKVDWGTKLEEADLGEIRLLRELHKRFRAETTHFWQNEAVENLTDNTTRMHATELLAELLGKRKAELNVHHDIIEIIPPPKPEDEPAGDD